VPGTDTEFVLSITVSPVKPGTGFRPVNVGEDAATASEPNPSLFVKKPAGSEFHGSLVPPLPMVLNSSYPDGMTVTAAARHVIMPPTDTTSTLSIVNNRYLFFTLILISFLSLLLV